MEFKVGDIVAIYKNSAQDSMQVLGRGKIIQRADLKGFAGLSLCLCVRMEEGTIKVVRAEQCKKLEK